MEDFWTAMQELPLATRPVYTTPKINEPVILYEGELELKQNDRVSKGQGKVALEWLPSINIVFEFNSYNCYAMVGDSTSLTLKDRDIHVSLTGTRSQGNQFSGTGRCEDINIGMGEELKYVLCHVANFHDLVGETAARLNTGVDSCRTIQRNILEEKDWKLTLDQLETTAEHVKTLSARGGFAITHVAKLERIDGQPFNSSDAMEFLDICSHVLSFARGFRVPVLLYVGYNSSDERVWDFWASRIGLSWKGVSSWFPESESGSLSKLFSGCLNWWRNWENVAVVILHWYLESNNNAGGMEGAIVLTQVALELLSWTLLVEKECIISRDGFDKLPASDKLRLLLSKLGIQSKIPPDCHQKQASIFQEFAPQRNHLDNLVTLAEQPSHKWVDGCHAITELRNSIVHPKKLSKVLDADSKAISEAKFLGLWYLELVLLALMNYDGCYVNRCIRPHRNAEPVPWQNKS
jgi:hypothetical protein